MEEAAAQMENAEADGMAYEDLDIGIDEALMVTLETVPGDAFEESHSHIIPSEDVAILHLVPPEAQDYHRQTAEFTEENL